VENGLELLPSLESARLVLEPLMPHHAARTFELWQDHRLYTFIPFEPPKDIASLEHRYRMLAARRSPDGTEEWFNWFARNKEDDTYVALIQVTIRSDLSAYLAYFTFAPYWRLGFAHEACETAIQFLVERGTRTVVAEIDTRNVASIRLIEKLGFQQESFTPAAAIIRGGVSDEYRYVRNLS